MIPLLVLAGPTASGKTGLAVELAEALGGEIISADSRQVYRRLDIGTAKPGPEERARAAHHLLDRVEPWERFSAGRFAREAAVVAGEIFARGRIPIVCGGTGFYIAALLEPMFEEPDNPEERKQAIRRELAERAAREGSPALHAKLAAIDPSSAARLHPNDYQRVSRALELYCLTGRTMTELLAESAQGNKDYRAFRVVLDPPPGYLKARIAERTDRMIEAGWLREVKSLLGEGVPGDAPGFQSLGYAEILAVASGDLGLSEARDGIISKTWSYARRQRTWFRRMDADMRPTDPQGQASEIAARWREFINSAGQE